MSLRRGSSRASQLAARPCALRPAVVARASALDPRPSRPGAVRPLFAASAARLKGIMPHTENPSKPDAPRTVPSYGVVDLSETEYHDRADAYLDAVAATFEHLQDSREDVDIEFSAGVMTINVVDKGTYVINKQPPNKQIWLSSPISGPKRYDWCIFGESQGEKKGTGSGNWIYTREGKSLKQLILDELGVVVDEPGQA